MFQKITIILSHELGGLKMVSVQQTIEIAKIMRIKRLCNDIDAKWKVLAFELMGLNRGQLLKWIPLCYIGNNVKDIFYKNIWSEFLKKTAENLNINDFFLDKNLFENQLFLVGDKPITKMRGQHLGDFENCRIRDIWNQDHKSVKSKTELEPQYNTVLPDMFITKYIVQQTQYIKN